MQQDDGKQSDDEAVRMALALRQSCLGVRVGRLHRLVSRQFEKALRPLGLSVAQLEVLSALILVDEPVRPTDLSNWLAVERSTVSRNLALMEKRGYVHPISTSPGGRSTRVTITPAGRGALARAEDTWSTTQAQLRAQLGNDAVATLDRWLGSLTEETATTSPLPRGTGTGWS